MTVRTLRLRGATLRRGTRGATATAWYAAETLRRFALLDWVLEARRMNMRAAHRRWLRRNGRSFNPPTWVVRRMA